LRVQATDSRPRFEVTCDGEGVVSHAGAALLVGLADRLGLTAALAWRAGRGQTPRHRHDAGAVLRDLAVMLADGGDCLGDLAALRDQPALFGPVASTATAWRVIEQVAGDELGLAGLRAARAQARGRAWQAGAHADGLLLVDIDGTLVAAHSDKQGAAGTYKGGFGFYPLVCFLDRQDGTGEALAGILRPGNAGSNTAADTSRSSISCLRNSQRPPGTSRSWSAPTPAAPPTPLPAIFASVACGSRSACRPTSVSAPRSWPSPTVPGSQQSTPTASRATAPRSPSFRASTWPAGRRGPGRSAAVRTPTPAPSCASPTPTGTASRSSSPTKTATSPCWNCATASTPASK
jgi:hypothetical protein